MAAIRPTRRTARTYTDENIISHPSHPSHPAKSSHSSSQPQSQSQSQLPYPSKSTTTTGKATGTGTGVGTGAGLGGKDQGNVNVGVGVKRPALSAKDQQPPRKISKHTRGSSITNKPAASRSNSTTGTHNGPLSASNSSNMVSSASQTSIVSAKGGRNSRQGSVDAVGNANINKDFSDATQMDEDVNMEVGGVGAGGQPSTAGPGSRKMQAGSGLTPSLTELDVAGNEKNEGDQPSSSRYLDVAEQDQNINANAFATGKAGVKVEAIKEETDAEIAAQGEIRAYRELQEGLILNDHEQLVNGAVGIKQELGLKEEALLDGEEFEGEMEGEDDEENWLALRPEDAMRAEEELWRVRQNFEDEVDEFDTSMVAEYSDEIFAVMGDLEIRSQPNADYMQFQQEMDWTMRATLIDWLLQVHLRYHMLPETLWIAINIVDRFLSARVVSLVKLQLVGVTAMFVAAKYEEILAPSVDEFVFMTEGGYSKDEILKGERIILQTLEFDVSSYCSPYSWVRRISKADDYDVQTRTLSKYLMEVTLLDHRFLRAKPSMIAAIGMYLARKMLDGDWSEGFVFYSGLTEIELVAGARILTSVIAQEGFDKQYVHKKYSTKKFLRASQFAGDWARHHSVDGVPDF